MQYRLDESDQGRFRIDVDTGIIFTRDNLQNLEGVTSNLVVSVYIATYSWIFKVLKFVKTEVL